VKAGDRIAIWLPNGPRWVELALAAKAVGAMVIAVNTRLHEREVQDILERSGATHIASAGETFGLPAVDDALPAGDGDPDAPWMVFTSSGTTGKPKLVVHTQRSLDAHAEAVAESFGDRGAVVL
jgi:fatty-acyl-CoA synthase